MIRKLLVLTAVAMLTASAVGCHCGRWFRRGALFPCYAPSTMVYEPSPPSGPCDPRVTPQLEAVPSITPGPETYLPAPTN